jgi:hypothetical protein
MAPLRPPPPLPTPPPLPPLPTPPPLPPPPLPPPPLPPLLITPIIKSLPIASAIYIGNALSKSILTGGITNVSGIFTFIDPSLILPLGNNFVSVTFTPIDFVNYNSVTLTIPILVISLEITSLLVPLNINLNLDMKGNIYNLNPTLQKNNCKFYSSDSKVAELDGLGNIKPKSKGRFYVVVTDTYGNIIYTSPYIEVKKGLGGSGGTPNF